jgi:iron(III) transport system substrate-binding protein
VTPRIGGLLALALVVSVPFLLRPKEDLLSGGETVIVVTPHNEAIRHEFGRAFREHVRARTGRAVSIDWRTPGGASEIARYIGSEYAASFETYWKKRLGKPWSAKVASSFQNPAVDPRGSGEGELARRAFLESNVGSGADVLFGGGSHDFIVHAAAGRLVDSGAVRAHPELFRDDVIPEKLGGQPLWDRGGLWVGACLSGFGICYNRDSLARLAVPPPAAWSDMALPAYLGQVALADPTKSASAVKAFEMIIQQQMNELGVSEGWDRAMLLIREIAANARYFTDSSSKIPLDVAAGDAAVGMCIDFYGRFQSESTQGGSSRLGFATPARGTSMDADPIGMLRGGPSPGLARELIEFVLSPEGQKLWDFRVGKSGGPERYALRRLPILPTLYTPPYNAYRSDPDVNPYEQGLSFVYHEEWTGPLFRAIAFVIRVMCVDTADELAQAWRALIEAGFPKEATARFGDRSLVGYEAVTKTIAAALRSADPVDEVKLGNTLVHGFRSLYGEVWMLARAGR